MKAGRTSFFAIACILACAAGSGRLGAEEGAAGAAPAAAVARWQDMRFGMFIHWGPVSLTGTEIGWSRGAQVPIEEYDALYKRFNPVEFDADAWAATARAAGMKYVVLTTKHHDGFCLWDTRETPHNIMNSPFKRDVVKELAEACRRQGLAFGTYYSTCDWHHPAFPEGSPGGRTKKPAPDLAAYDRYLRAQTRELISNYGPLLTIWFDVPQSYGPDFGVPMVKELRALQPDILINNRAYSVGGRGSGIGHQNRVGDYDTPEQEIGAFQLDRPWETCMTICRQWAWKPDDQMKSLDECIATLVACAGGGGNLLFNVGPTPEGIIEERQVGRLREMGAWLERNGEAIYGTRGGPLKPAKGLATTRRANTIYLHVLPQAPDPLKLPPLARAIKSAEILGGGAVEFRQSPEGVEIALPATLRLPAATVVKLDLDGSAMDLAPLELPRDFTAARASNVFENQTGHYGPEMAIDGNPGTRWATDAGTAAAWIELDLPAARTVGGLEIREEFAGRIQEFAVLAEVGGAWETVATGKNPAECRFEKPVETKRLRLEIRKASDGPTIAEIALDAD
jgi:alpha-L-fucosidase